MTTRSDIATIRTTNWLLATKLADVIGDVLHDTGGYPQAELHVEYGITGITIYHQAPAAVLELVDDHEDVHGFVDEVSTTIDVFSPTAVEEIDDAQAPEPAARREAPAPDPDGEVRCEFCEATYRTSRAVSDHIRAAHWDDVIDAYDAHGVGGITETFGVAKSTAYRWAKDLQGEVA